MLCFLVFAVCLERFYADLMILIGPFPIFASREVILPRGFRDQDLTLRTPRMVAALRRAVHLLIGSDSGISLSFMRLHPGEYFAYRVSSSGWGHFHSGTVFGGTP